MEGDPAGELAVEPGVFWRFRREVALTAVGMAAAVAAFFVGPAWGWRVAGGFLMVMAAWVFFTGQAAFLFPGLKLGYITGRNATAAAIGSAAIGLALMVNAKPLEQWTHRSCRALGLQACQGDPVCVNSDIVSVTSPARSVRAVKYGRSCDGSDVVTTHVSIVNAGQPLADQSGNTFVVEGRADLLLFWVDGKHLAISGAGNGNRQLQQVLVNGVRVTYEDRPR
jgi:hypothetical protein